MKTPRRNPNCDPTLQMRLPGVSALEAGREKTGIRNQKIPHRRLIKQFQDGSTDLLEIYRVQVLPVKTRTIHLLGRKAPARIITTLLGYEVQAQYKRIHCPDLVTARYLKLFTELGCHSIKLPYDPTVTARLLPQLESCVASITEGVRRMFAGDRTLQIYVQQKICSILRSQLRAA